MSSCLVPVVAPPWLVNFIAQYFNIGLFDSRGMDYFEQLSNTIIENRENGSTGNDFVQMLVNHMVEAPPGQLLVSNNLNFHFAVMHSTFLL